MEWNAVRTKMLVTMCSLATATASLGAAEPVEFHVAVDGSDTNPGTADRPFATPQRAQDAVRALVAAGLTTDVTVHLRGGTYYLPQGLEFRPEDSGTAEHRITYTAFAGEVPALVGGMRLDGWQDHADATKRTTIPAGIAPKQLFEDGQRLTLARTPNTGYLAAEKAGTAVDALSFVYREADLDPAGWDLADAAVNIWPHHDWFNFTHAISTLDPETRTIVLDADPRKVNPGNRYYIHNVLALLDEAGECQIAQSKGHVYVWPRSRDIDTATIVASSADAVILVRGEPDRPVRNLHFKGLDIGISNRHAVLLTNVEDCSLRDCKIENAQECGVLVDGPARRCTVTGCLIRYHGLHGVHLQGLAPGKPDVNKHHVVENNHIHHCGRLIGHGYGVRISQSGHNRVLHNHIHHMPRYATTIKGVRYQVLRKQIPGVTFENRHDFLHSRHNLIAYNDIHDVNQNSQDTGAMESWGPGRDNVYDHNLIRATGNRQFNLQSGMYLDDATDYFTVTNNIIYGVVGTNRNQPIYAKGIGNRFENNILVVGPHCDSGISSFFMADERSDSHEYVRNIIYFAPSAGRDVARGRFGQVVGELHDPGTTLVWESDMPAAGAYDVWMRYAADNAPFGKANMDSRTTLTAGDAKPVWLTGLPNTGSWGKQEWHKAGRVECAAGKQTLRWVNVKGGGLNIDALVLTDDREWAPDGLELPAAAAGRHVVVVQAEEYVARNDVARDRDRRGIYHFQNWSKNRVVTCDHNLYWNPNGAPLKVSGQMPGGGKDRSYDGWRKALGGKFDANSVVADPLFVDPALHDYRLRPDSPALKLGFKPIDTSRIGLKSDFPARFERE